MLPTRRSYKKRVCFQPPQLPDLARSSSRVRVLVQPVRPSLRGNRDELHVSGSSLAFVMPRDAELLAHRWLVYSTGRFLHRSAFKPPISFETNLVLLVLHRRRSEAGVHERLANCDTPAVLLHIQEGRPSRASG